MSCSTLNVTALNLNVSVANLPEGFCPANMQELANAIGARLIITPNTSFNTFAIGSTAPSSNVGPWFKDCNQWFVYDDATGTYIPIFNTSAGGFKNEEFHSVSGSFTVPDSIYLLDIELWGGGGGGGVDTGNVGAGGGGAGGYVKKIVSVTPGQIIPYTIGAGGMSGTPATAGGASSFLTLSAGGGLGSPGGAVVYGVIGGSGTGGDMNITGQSGLNATSGFGGTGGSAARGGGGGTYIAPPNAALLNGKIPGGGGSGDYSSSGAGAGANGGILIRY